MKQLLVALLGLVILVTACASPAPTVVSAPKITIESAWGRTSPMVAQAGAFYMLVRNAGSVADRLASGKSTACDAVELHESYAMPNGVMGMRPITGTLEIPANGQVELKAGGYHIMCIGKKVDLNQGVKIPLTLIFEKSGEINVTVEIRDQAM